MEPDYRQLVEQYAQAMWDALGILGFDRDGDASPHALIAGMGHEGYIAKFLEDVREERDDYDALLDELKELETTLLDEAGE